MQMCEQCAPNPIIKSGYVLGLYNVVGEAGLMALGSNTNRPQ